jgi:hypothetical protein
MKELLPTGKMMGLVSSSKVFSAGVLSTVVVAFCCFWRDCSRMYVRTPTFGRAVPVLADGRRLPLGLMLAGKILEGSSFPFANDVEL